MFRPVALIAVFALLSACSRENGGAPDLNVAAITIEAKAEGPWRVEYRMQRPATRIVLGPSPDDYRTLHWKIDGAGARLVRRDGEDLIEAVKGKISSVRFEVTPAPILRPKDYSPFIAMGNGGYLVYTGEFIPYQDKDLRMASRLTVIAQQGAHVTAFGRTEMQFADWESPYRNPAFIYVGPIDPVRSDAMETVIDEAAPSWVRTEVSDFAPKIAAALAKLFGRQLLTTPDIFVAIGDLSEEGRLSYRGDALPGQYQMTLVGGGWKTRTEEAASVLRRSTAHEAAHLWQAAARPRSDAVPNWIHEGGASALAMEALIVAGDWSLADAGAEIRRARAECAAGLAGASLDRAEAGKDWPTVYACGEIANIAAAGEAGPAAFWREFTARASANGGYDEALFLDLARERAGDDAKAAIAELARINNARAEPLIDRMLGRVNTTP